MLVQGVQRWANIGSVFAVINISISKIRTANGINESQKALTSANVGSMLARRLRRRPSIDPTLAIIMKIPTLIMLTVVFQEVHKKRAGGLDWRHEIVDCWRVELLLHIPGAAGLVVRMPISPVTDIHIWIWSSEYKHLYQLWCYFGEFSPAWSCVSR